MASDPYKSTAQSADSFGTKGRTITPGATDIDPIPKGLVVLSAGDATIVPVDNANAETLAFTGLAAGAIIPFRVRRVTAATATLATIDG